MKACFLIPTLGDSGGVHVMFEHAQIMASRGHEAVVIYPMIPPNINAWRFKEIFALAKYIVWIPLNLMHYNQKKYKKLYPNVQLKQIFSINFVSNEFDKYIASWWECTIAISKIKEGKKINFVQGYDPNYENWSVKTEKLIKSTYRLKDIKILTITKYLSEQLRKDGAESVEVIYNNIDLNEFLPNIKERKYNAVGVIYRSSYSKGLINFINYMRKYKRDDIEYHCIGLDVPPNVKNMFDHVYKGDSKKAMNNFYNRIGLLIIPSLEEGFSLPVTEAMSCGTLVGIKKIGIAADLVCDGENSFILENNSKEEIKKCIDNYMNLNSTTKLELYKNAVSTVRNEYVELSENFREKIISFYES